MPQPILDPLAAQITASDDVIDSAVLLVNGIQGQIDAAVAKATAGGATPAQLAPFVDLSAALKTKTDALAAAVLANTPAAPTP